jgi:enoyl-CoA hydratase/carnithine racemase
MQNLIKIYDVTKNIVRIELTNGKKHNPLSLELMKSLTYSLKEISSRSNVRVLIISSEGPGFSAGHDLEELKRNKNDKEFFKILFNECSHLMQTIMGLTQPVIAEVCGIAAAAGCQLVASCDLAVASEQATFMTPGVNIGLFCSTPMVAVSRNISRKKMMEMLLTGEKLSAQEAVDFGLVNHCVSFDKLENKTLALADLIASKPRSTVTIGKEAFYKQLEMPVVEAYTYTSEVMAMNMLELDAHEGINAFLEKRVPSCIV